MNEQEMRAWIDNASYEELLRKNRFAPSGDPIFRGSVGAYFIFIMGVRRAQVGNEEHVRASKAVGF